MNVLDILVMVLYFGGITAMGVYFARRNKSTEEYFLGNRNFPGWAIGLSLVGTSISSLSFLGIPGDSFKTAWLRFLVGVTMPLVVIVAAYVFLPFYRRTKTTSAFEYLEHRFGPTTRLYGAVTFLIAQLVRISMILYLLSLVLHELSDMPLWLCIVLSGVFVSFYTVAGGMEAVVWTDVIQTVILTVGGVLCLAKVVALLPGGLGEIISVGVEHGKFQFAELMEDGTLRNTSWAFSLSDKTALMIVFVGLTHFMAEYACNQNVVQRYCASASAREARKAMFVCCVSSLVIWTFFRFLGTSLYVFFERFPNPDTAAMLSGAQKAEQVLPYFVLHYMPRGISGLVLAAVLAAAMSSLDSSLNAISTVSIVDIYRRHLVKERDDRHYLRVARAIAIGASAFMLVGAWALAYSENKTLGDTGTALSAILAGGLLGLYLLGFLTVRGDARAVNVAIVCTVLWSLYMTLVRYGWLPEACRLSVDSYYTGIIGHLLM
ncbi:MAG TPA: sodium:solute symporter, partial [Candidatus Hydrogenedentes bacterium]|nr:sodium:solute symporter [Candidatus Hydrogenedentota bacterium]